MLPCRSSSLCSLCFLLSYRTEHNIQPGTDAILKTQLEDEAHLGRPTHNYTLTLSFLKSSYSGLSVGNSSRHSGQELVYEWKHTKDSKGILKLLKLFHNMSDEELNSKWYTRQLYLAQPGQYASRVEKMFARHFSNCLLFLKLQQTHRTLETFICKIKKRITIKSLPSYSDPVWKQDLHLPSYIYLFTFVEHQWNMTDVK